MTPTPIDYAAIIESVLALLASPIGLSAGALLALAGC